MQDHLRKRGIKFKYRYTCETGILADGVSTEQPNIILRGYAETKGPSKRDGDVSFEFKRELSRGNAKAKTGAKAKFRRR